MVQYVGLAPHISMMIDEEGLLKYNQHFKFLESPIPFSGNAIIIGLSHSTDEDGNSDFLSIPKDVSKDMIQEHLVWLGGDDALERNIQKGIVFRPKTQMGGFGAPMETIWEWAPHSKPS